MNRKENDLNERFTDAISIPSPVQKFLLRRVSFLCERIEKLSEESAFIGPPNRTIEEVHEWMVRAQKRHDEFEGLTLQLRRIEGYIGHQKERVNTRTLEEARYLAEARWIRKMIQNGDSDKDIADHLRISGSGKSENRRGRPSGSLDCDGHALAALVMHDSDPKFWTFPKLADGLLICRVHKAHTADSSCSRKLQKSVERFRKFLSELGYERVET